MRPRDSYPGGLGRCRPAARETVERLGGEVRRRLPTLALAVALCLGYLVLSAALAHTPPL